MKISLNWLRDYLDWTGSPEDLDGLLTRTGLTVESRETSGLALDNVVVAQILESSQHPNADRLSVCRVDDGSGHPRQIVCGAKNYKVGDKVPLALPGAILPGDFKIKVGKLRGVESEGMLCSAKELRLAEDADGLLILPADATVGAPIGTLFPSDTVLDLEITPNRPDWLSHFGVAREIGVFTDQQVKLPSLSLAPQQENVNRARIEDPAGCSYYTVLRIAGVTVGPSPDWLRQHLQSVGLRSINNVVDVTNYVMFEFGQPLHAFDAAKITNGIRVRKATDGEQFTALDGKTYQLKPHHLVVADEQRAVALAGIMGGADSGVTTETKDILLEAAFFEPSLIRRTARELDLHSDSSYRFERGVDPEMIAAASARAVSLIVQVAGGRPETVLYIAGSEVLTRHGIALRHSRCRDLLGCPDLGDDEIIKLLNQIGLQQAETVPGNSQWIIPGFRRELMREVDLIEEVARLLGIDRIPSQVTGWIATPTAADAAYDFQMTLRQKLVAQGFYEARTSTLISRAMAEENENCLLLKNPLGEDQSVLRPSLLPALREALARNVRQGAAAVQLFEIGRTFAHGPTEETSRLALVLWGNADTASWRGGNQRKTDFFDLKGLLVRLIGGNPQFTVRPTTDPRFVIGVDVLSEDGTLLGVAGQVHPVEARRLDVSGAILAAELDLTVLKNVAEQQQALQLIPKFPAVTRDLAILVSSTTPYQDIEKTLAAANEPLLEKVDLFDVYVDSTGQRLAAEKKSLAISLTFRSPDRTLSSEEVIAAFERLKDSLKQDLAADFR